MSASKLMYSSPRPKTQSVISYGNDRDKALSPSRTKISQLSEKLSNLQNSIDDDYAVYNLLILNKIVQKRYFEKKVKVLEDKSIKQQQEDESKFKLLKEQLQKVEESVQNEKIIRENGDEKLRNKDLKILELNLGKELQYEKINKKDYEQKITKTTDRVYSLRLDLVRQKNIEKKQKKRMLKNLEIEFYNYKKMLKKKKDQGKREINKLLKIRKFNIEITINFNNREKQHKLRYLECQMK